jgi:hypothetical protein
MKRFYGTIGFSMRRNDARPPQAALAAARDMACATRRRIRTQTVTSAQSSLSEWL